MHLSRAILCSVFQFVSLAVLDCAQASLEEKIGVAARTYPVSGVTYGSIGWAQILWGDTNSPYYTYVKPEFTAYLTKSYNAQSGKLRFFPLSFIELYYAYERSDNGAHYDGYDCVNLICRGRFKDIFFGFNMAIKYEGFFLVHKYRNGKKEYWGGEVNTKSFIDPDQMLKSQSGDEYSSAQWVLGYDLSPEWRVSFLYFESHNLKDHGKSFIKTFNLHYKWNEEVDLFYGTGIAHPNIRTQQVTHLLSLTWKLTPTIDLF